jgi:catalase
VIDYTCRLFSHQENVMTTLSLSSLSSINPSLPVVAAVLLLTVTPSLAADPGGIVDGLRTNAGNPPNARASFAKGQCARGTYTPAAGAAQITRSISFTTPSTVIGRLSVGGGNPKVTDTSKAVLRGLSVKLQSAGSGTDLLFENAPVHFAKSLDQMLQFLQARAPGPDGKPNTDKVAAFTAANPETARQAAYVAARPLPGSYAGIVYWGVHTFTATNAGGKSQSFKFKIVPEAGEITLSDEDAKTRAADFLSADLVERLGRGPIKFSIVALLKQPGDTDGNLTDRWPDEDKRTGITLGTIALTAIENNETCDATIFDPANLADGIGAPKDELFRARQEAYAISLGHRRK